MPERTPNGSPTLPADGRIRPFTHPFPLYSQNREKPASAQDIKSFVRKILLASPDFPRLYADVILHYAPNSFEAKILAQSYEKNCCPHQKGPSACRTSNPALISRSPESAAALPLSAESSSATSTSACSAPSKIPPRASITTPCSRTKNPIQASLMEGRQRPAARHHRTQARRTDPARVLNTAVRNIRRVKFGVQKFRRHGHRRSPTTPIRPSNKSTRKPPSPRPAPKSEPTPSAPAPNT